MTAGAWGVDLIVGLAWPVVILVILGSLVLWPKARDGFATLAGRVRRVKAFAFELELSEEAASQVKELTEESFRELRQRVKAEYDRQVATFSVIERFQRLIVDNITPVVGVPVEEKEFRATLHVEDVVFTHTIYQLLDYYPRGKGRGRTFPDRFGIVGKAWRLAAPQIDSKVSTDPAELVREWGMTYQEATAAGQGRHSFAAIPLMTPERVRVGLVYLDAEVGERYGRAEGDSRDEMASELIGRIEDGVRSTGLVDALDQLMNEMKRRGPAIALHEVGE